VTPKEDIYNFASKLATLINSIKASDVDQQSKSAILDFYQDYLAQGYSLARKIKYLTTLKCIGLQLDKPFQIATRQDIATWVSKLESANYSAWTKRDYKVILKVFFRWLKKSEAYPSEVDWIKASRARNHTLPEQLITEEEVKRIAERATHPRDKALVLVLYESGCRIGEILSLTIGNVEFDEYGGILLVNGKTGQRRVRIIASAPALALWIDNHPLRDHPDAPLWINLGAKNRCQTLTYGGAKSLVKEIVYRAGIKKRVYPHLFRHSRATHLANHLTESQLKQHFGWVQGSAMASVYVHLSGRDVDRALLELNGINLNKEEEAGKFKAIDCPRCKNRNSPISKFCNRCGLALDLKAAIELDETRNKADKLITDLIKDSKVIDSLMEAVERIKSSPQKARQVRFTAYRI
jgi:integrase/recombinase XerD